MAQQPKPTPIVALHAVNGQNHFISHASSFSGTWFPGVEMGSQGVDHGVLVFDEGGAADHPVVLCIGAGAFALQEYLTAAEARALAHALLMAASFTERTDLDRGIDVAMAAAGVAA